MPMEAVQQPGWVEQIPADQWKVYQSVIEIANQRGVQFAMGGAFAVATHTSQWRNTKDLDFYVLPTKRFEMIAAVTDAGLRDYFDVLEYDRGWIYRSHLGETIVDVIWSMANRRALVDESWLRRGPMVRAHGFELKVVPVEEMIWGKIYIMQKTRCDWIDILNMIYTNGPLLDWDYLIQHLGPDLPLLRGVLSVFSWLCPERALELPKELWSKIQLPEPEHGTNPDTMRQRANLLDTRPWFVAIRNE